MDDNNPKIKQMEQELDQLQQQATQNYQGSKTNKFYKSPEPKASKQTYVEQEQIASMPQHVGTGESTEKIKGSKLKLIFKVGIVLIMIAFLVAGAFYLIGAMSKNKKIEVTSWDDCLLLTDSTIEDSYPRVCRTADGQQFVESIENIAPVVTPVEIIESNSDAEETVSADNCEKRGCSGELCQDVEDESVYTVCEIKPEYACYKQAVCERQDDSLCGWTLTEELTSCLAQY